MLMVVALSRIFGTLWYYLSLWGWAIGLLTLAATLGTVAAARAERAPASSRDRWARSTAVALGALALVVTLRFTIAEQMTKRSKK